MIKKLSQQQAKIRLQALESTGSIPIYPMLPEEVIHVPGHGPRYLIPYLMSDVIEDYLIICGLPAGTVFSEDITTEELLTLPKIEFLESVTMYRFDRIGHLWVDDHPVIRRLVNFSLCLRNVYRFIDAEDSGPLLPYLPQLVEFAPFRYWSPIHENIDDWAEDTPAGLDAFRHYAEKAGDSVLMELLSRYDDSENAFLVRRVAEEIARPEHSAVIELIADDMDKQSSFFPNTRSYGPESDLNIKTMREDFTRAIQSQGYSGIYPDFYRMEAAAKGTVLKNYRAYEEYPFTVLEDPDFVFNIVLYEL